VGLAIVAMMLATSFVPSATASTGAFTHGTATPDWRHANFGITGSTTVCGTGACSWFPMVIAEPSLPEYRCGYGGEEAFDSNPNTQEVWAGLPSRTSDGTFSADQTNQSILPGVFGQRLCLAIVGEHEVKDLVCEAQKKVFEEFGLGPISCPPVKRAFEENLGSILLTVEPPAPVPMAVPTSPASKMPTPSLRCPKAKKKARRNGKLTCVKRHFRKPKKHNPSS
jgi:hypothetical protein